MMIRHRPPPRTQTGAVLYVALIMLVLLALIGVVAMQVASLQERMSANYQSTNMAFQNAEGDVRERELELEEQLLAGISPPTNIPSMACMTAFNPQTWTGADPHVRRMDQCIDSGVDMTSLPEEERTDQIYQITVYSRDRAIGPTSEAVIDTVFIP